MNEMNDEMQGLNDDLGRLGRGKPFMSRRRQNQGLKPHVIPMTSERSIYEYLRTVYPKEVLVTQSFLRSVIAIPFGTAIQQLNFILTKNDQTAPATSIENRLDQSDTFETLEFRFGWFTLPCDAAGLLTGNIAQAEFQYFNNPRVFTGANESLNMNGAYNGSLYVKIGDTVYFEQYPTEDFKKVGTTEKGVAVSTVATTGVIPVSSGDGKKMGATVTPVVMVDGSGKNQFQINLPAPLDLSAGAIGVATRANFVFFECRGFKCQNGAKQPTLKFRKI